MGNAQKVRDLAHSVGFSGESEVTAVAVSLAENRDSNAAAVSPPNKNGTRDYGLWQINSVHFGMNLGNIGTSVVTLNKTNVLDPKINARAAYLISKKGTDFSPWVTYKNGAYKSHLDEARATNQPGNPVSDYFNNGQTQGITSAVTSVPEAIQRALASFSGWFNGVLATTGIALLAGVLIILGVVILARKQVGNAAISVATDGLSSVAKTAVKGAK